MRVAVGDSVNWSCPSGYVFVWYTTSTDDMKNDDKGEKSDGSGK